jgi:ribulose-phosphate 3-epimerase
MVENRFLIAGSILSADLLNLERDVGEALEKGVDIIHFDVMDYHFVPNMTFGPAFLKALRDKFPSAVFDVHLMVSPVSENIVDDYINAGASWISFHPEACIHTQRMLAHIKERGVKSGLVLNPSTPPTMLKYLWNVLDFVLVMTVNPGFGGQKIIPLTLEKVKDIAAMALGFEHQIMIEVDGGVKASNIKEIATCGANVFVVGSAFFGVENKEQALTALRAALS